MTNHRHHYYNHHNSPLTWKHGLNVPGEETIQKGVKVHHDDGSAEVKATVFCGSQKVQPLDPDALLLKQGKVLTAKPKSHWRQESLWR